jgi:hypothetical protein
MPKINKQKKTPVRQLAVRTRVKKRVGARLASAKSNVYADKVLALWRDPCRADLIHPPYEGTDAGYLVRTVDIYNPGFVPTTTGSYTGDFYLSWSPWNYGAGTGYVYGGNSAGGAFTLVNDRGPGNFILTSVVDTYRPVGSCLEWVPTDQVLSRSGTVSMGYVPSVPNPATEVSTIAKILPMCQETVTNGFDKEYSINWLPSMNDERFTTSAGTVGGVGTVFCALQGVQLPAATVAGTGTTMGGFFRVTTVWEWTPQFNNGIQVDPRTPSGWSAAEIMARAGDIKKLLFSAHDIASGFSSAMRFAGRRNNPGANLLTF